MVRRMTTTTPRARVQQRLDRLTETTIALDAACRAAQLPDRQASRYAELSDTENRIPNERSLSKLRIALSSAKADAARAQVRGVSAKRETEIYAAIDAAITVDAAIDGLLEVLLSYYRAQVS